MDELKRNLLANLADYTNAIHIVFEGRDHNFDERLVYLGHLAMCARIFKSVYLGESAESLEVYLKIENGSFKFGTPRNELGARAREAWGIFSAIYQSYITALRNA